MASWLQYNVEDIFLSTPSLRYMYHQIIDIKIVDISSSVYTCMSLLII